MLPNWLIFDMKYRIIRRLDFEKPVRFDVLQKISGIRDNDKFLKAFDYLGSHKYLELDPHTGDVRLRIISSRDEYLSDRWQLRFVGIGTLAAVVAAVFAVLVFFKH